MTRLLFTAFVLLNLVVFAGCRSANSNPELHLGPDAPILVAGTTPDIRVNGLRHGEIIRVHSLRKMEKWAVDADGTWQRTSPLLHGWAKFEVGKSGVVNLNTDIPIEGTWREAGSLALLWSGLELGDAGMDVPVELKRPEKEFSDISIGIETKDGLVGQGILELTTRTDDVVVEDVRTVPVNGAFAYRRGAQADPLLIVIHGSEGSGPQIARDAAALFARQGYAAFALSYYTRPNSSIPGVPNDGSVNRPVEMVAAARDWVKERGVGDTTKIGLRGVSKGAELALLAGSQYNWVKAIVACVPSDVVWQGFGREPKRDEVASSWTLNDAPLPYIPHPYNFNVFTSSNPGATATQWHQASRQGASLEQVEAARIPVEKITGNTLLIGGDLDEVWPSGDMIRAIMQRFTSDTSERKISSLIFPNGNHQICGPGNWPTNLYHDPAQIGAADPVDVGQNAVEGWAATLSFLKKHLKD